MKSLLWTACLLAAAVVILWSNGPLDVDDAPITYRYAENLAAGQGFVYNPGEHILGTSTPLYTLLLAGLRLLGIPIPLASTAINFLSSLAVVYLTMLIAERLNGSYGAGVLAALYLLFQSSFVRYTMAGMETPLYTLLILATFWLVTIDRFAIAALLAGLAAVMRLDGLAVGGALFLGYLLHHRRLPWRALLVYGVTFLPWTLFAFSYFGSPIPLSMLAKQTHLQARGTGRYWIWHALFTTNYGAPIYLLPVGLIGIPAFLGKHGLHARWTIPLIWLGSYLTAYTLVGIDFYEWYLTPVYPIFAIVIGTGLYALWTAIRRGLKTTLMPALPTIALLLLLLFWLIPYAQHLTSSVAGFKGYLADREQGRIDVGNWLRANTALDATVYAGAIGHKGYQSMRYMIDGAGLITHADQLHEIHPDYYAVEGWGPNTLNCGVVKEFIPPPNADSPAMVITACGQQPYAHFGGLILANVRIGRWIQAADHSWATSPGPSIEPTPYVEFQWLLDAPPDSQEWTVYLHALDAQGQLLFQLDHQLGLQTNGSVYPVTEWSPEVRTYTYVSLPDDWQTQKPTVAALRIGIWNPTTQEYLPVTEVRNDLTLQEGLLIKVVDGEIIP